MATQVGRRIVEMVGEDLRPSAIQTRAAYLNAIAVAMAMGCSTNAIIHVIAMAKRANQDIGLDDFDRISRVVPVIANVRPSGTSQYLMEDFYYAGGLPALMQRIAPHLALDQLTVTGKIGRREHRRRPRPQRRRDPAARPAGLRRGLARGAARQPRDRRLRDQAERDEREVPGPRGARPSCSTTIRR